MHTSLQGVSRSNPLFLAAWIAASGVALLAMTGISYAAELVPVRAITVSGHAERKMVPDEAHLMVNLNALSMKLPEAKAEHDKKLKQLMDIVEKAGIDSKKVRSEGSSSQPQYDYNSSQRIFRGYRMQTQIDITVTSIDKVGDLMESINNAGFEKGASTEWGNLMSINYSIAEPEKARDEILADAIANARSKAEKMAKAAGASLGSVQQISEVQVAMPYPRPVPMMAMAKVASAAADAEMAPPPGEQEMQANVTVTYELK